MCPDCGFEGRQLSPGDAVVAARSLPRRFREAVLRRDDEEKTDALVRRRPSDGGSSVIELVAEAAAELDARADDIRAISISEMPAVGRPARAAPIDGVDATLDALDGAASRFATAVSEANDRGGDWTRSGDGPQGAQTALDTVAAGIHAAVHRLRRIDAVLQDVRGRPE